MIFKSYQCYFERQWELRLVWNSWNKLLLCSCRIISRLINARRFVWEEKRLLGVILSYRWKFEPQMLCFTRKSICSSFARVSFSPRPPTPRAIMRTNLLWNFIQKMFQKQTVPKITLLVVNWLIGKENPVLRYAIQVCFRLFYLERPRDVVSYPSFVSLQLVNLYQYRVAMSLNYFSTELNCFNI